MTQIAQNVRRVKAAIANAAEGCGRDPRSIKLVAVSKTMPVEKIRAAMAAGHLIFGENYMQDALEKISAIDAPDVRWHFIGHLQTNKAALAVKCFDLIHTVDSVKLARAIDRQAEKNDKVQPILVQVNVSGEAAKFGIDKASAPALVREIAGMQHIAVRGLMTMPPYNDNPEKARPHFAALAALSKKIEKERIDGVDMEELSMGMSGDFAVAIAEGATLVRVGTSIFGARK